MWQELMSSHLQTVRAAGVYIFHTERLGLRSPTLCLSTLLKADSCVLFSA